MTSSASRCRPATRNATSGYNQASVGNGWRPFAGDENNWGTIPNVGTPGAAERHQPSGRDRHVFRAAEPGLQRQWHRAQAHERPADVAVQRRWTRSPRRSTTPTPRTRCCSSAMSSRCGSTSVRRRAAGRTARWPVRSSIPRPSCRRPAICRWAARSSPPRTRTTRSASTSNGKSTDSFGLELDYPQLHRRVGRRQPVRLERGARCRRLLSRHHHGGLQQGLPGDERGVACRADRHRRVADDGHGFELP